MKKFLCIILCFVILLSGCSEPLPDGVTEVIFSAKLLTIAGKESDGWDSDFAEHSVKLSHNRDGDLIVYLDAEQVEYWRELWAGFLDSACDWFKSKGHGYKIVIYDDYSGADFYYNSDLDPAAVIYYAIQVEIYSVCLQLLNGADSYNWVFNMDIYDSDTGNLVTSDEV